MFDRIQETPGFWPIVALALAVIGTDVAILLLSRARLARQESAQRRAAGGDWQAVAALKRPSRLPEIVAALLPLALAATSAGVIQSSRNLLVAAMSEVDPTQKFLLSSLALSGELNTTALALWAVPPAVLVSCVTVAVAVSARLRARGLLQAAALAVHPDHAGAWLKFPGPHAGELVAVIGTFFVLGFGPIVRAGFEAITARIRTFAGAAGLPPGEKGAILSEGLDRASSLLDKGLVSARVGVALAVLIGFLAWRFSSQRERARLLGGGGGGGSEPREGVFIVLIALGAIAMAVVGFLAARPIRVAGPRTPVPLSRAP